MRGDYHYLVRGDYRQREEPEIFIKKKFNEYNVLVITCEIFPKRK